jgi:hypothetical protein
LKKNKHFYEDQGIQLLQTKLLLLDSRFTLCPSGSGPNYIRLWESLACGCIPVLLADTLDLPNHKLWDESIVFY